MKNMAHAHELMRTDYIVADIGDTVASLLGQMERHGQCYAAVFEGSNYLGIAAKKWLLSSRIDPATMKLKNLVTHRSKSKTPFFVPKLAPETELKEIARLMATADIHALPVIVNDSKKEKVVGVVHSADVVRELRTFYARVRADELGSMKLTTVSQDEELGKAVNLMSKQNIGRVVVVDGANKLIGVLSLTDVLLDVHAFPRSNMHMPRAASHQKGKHTGFGTGEKDKILKLPVHNIVTHVPNCCTASPKDSVATVIDKMADEDVSSVILTTDDKPVGIITIKDILEDFSK